MASKVIRIAVCVLLVASTSACGLGLFDEAGRKIDNLPTQAVGPYGKPVIDFDTPADEPYVLDELRASLWNPSALARDGGGFRIWYGREDIDAVPGESELYYFELPDITELPDLQPARMMSADAPWEEGRVASPSVIDLGGGHLVMLYEGGIANPAIGRADSIDNGASWQKHAANPLVVNAYSPAVGELEGEWFLFYTVPARNGIFMAEGTDGVGWTARVEPVVVPRPRLRQAFDSVAVSDPFVIIERTPAGQRHFGLYFNGENLDADLSIGYAGSLDGEVWHSFSDEEPILAAGTPSERSATVVRTASRGVMFFSEPRQGRQRIAVATHP